MRLRLKSPRLRSASLTGAVLAIAAASPSLAGEQIFRVDLNKTQILRLPTKAGSIVVGNPQIADISIHSPEMIFVVGRGYGETNLIVLDRNGRTVMDADIQVTSVTPDHGVRIFNAKSRETYSCAPFCQPSPILGDNPEFVGQNATPTGESEGPGSLFEDMFGGGDTAAASAGGQAGVNGNALPGPGF